MNAHVGSAPTSAAAVANEFLALGRNDSSAPPIDQMKLQKLLFYAHAWYLAQTGNPLFEEDFEAWPWGPVVRDVYTQTADSGRAPVSKWISQLTRTTGSNPFDFNFTTPRVLDEGLGAYIKGVWESHKAFTGTQLSNATHLTGEPWTIVKERYGSLDGKPTIPNDLIASVFRQKMANVSSTTHSAATTG